MPVSMSAEPIASLGSLIVDLADPQIDVDVAGDPLDGQLADAEIGVQVQVARHGEWATISIPLLRPQLGKFLIWTLKSSPLL